MKKIILAALVVASLFASCSSEKTLKRKMVLRLQQSLMAGLVKKTR